MIFVPSGFISNTIRQILVFLRSFFTQRNRGRSKMHTGVPNGATPSGS